MPNVIFNSSMIKSVNNGGRTIAVKFATDTSYRKRTYLATEVQESVCKALENAVVPPGATVAIMAETEHPSQKDQYPHFTIVYQDDNGKHITTKPVYPA